MPSKTPLRGEIWFVQLHVDPPDKGRRPVVIVSLDATSIHKGVPTHVFLAAGETGLQSDSAARAEDVTVVRKQSLVEPRGRLRQLSDKRVCELASKVSLAMGCTP